MQQRMERLKEAFAWFVDQSEVLVLVLDTGHHDLPITLKLIEAVEAQREAEIFLTFAHGIHDAHLYVDELMKNIRIQLRAVQALCAAEGLPPWPEPPPACNDGRISSSDRVIALLGWVREQLPDPNSHIVLSLLPATIESPAAYLALLRGLLPWNGVQPWMERVRILVRDDRNQRFLLPQLEHNKLREIVVVDDIDFSPERMEEIVTAQAADPNLDEGERANAMMQLAGIDLAHGRFDAAFHKWVALAAYYHKYDAPAMAAHCLCGAGDVLMRIGKPADAKTKYQQGLGIAQTPEAAAVALPLLMGAGRACLALQQWQEAEGYLALADPLSLQTVQMPQHAEVCDLHGVALLAIGQTEKAAEQFRVAVDVGHELHHYVCAESALEHLIALFRSAGMRTEAAAHEHELKALRDEKHRFLDDPRSFV